MRQTSSTRWHSRSSILTAVTITLLFGCSGGGGDPHVHLATAIDCIGKADAIMDQVMAGAGPHTITKADYTQRYEYYKTALKETRLIDISLINKDNPILGEHCQNELLQGLEWVLKGEKKDDDRLKMSGQVLLDRFVEWYQSHKDEIRKSLSSNHMRGGLKYGVV